MLVNTHAPLTALEVDGGVRDGNFVGRLGLGGVRLLYGVEVAVTRVRDAHLGAVRREKVTHRAVVSPVRHVALPVLGNHPRCCPLPIPNFPIIIHTCSIQLPTKPTKSEMPPSKHTYLTWLQLGWAVATTP
jgi:hypothetical protein